jgi:hypothetical protein
MTDSTSECPSCKRPFAATVPVCPFCGARRGASTQAPRPSAPPPTAKPRELQGTVDVLTLDDVWSLVEMHDREVDGRRVKELKVYAHTTAPPPHVTYQPLTGPQVVSLFLKTHADTLVIAGLGAPLTIDHYEASNVAKALPEAEPVSAKIVRSR